MKIVKILFISILLILFLISWVLLLYRKTENEKFSNSPENIKPWQINKIIKEMRNDGNYYTASYNPYFVRGHSLPDKEIKQCEMLNVEDSYLKNRKKISHCMSIIPVSVRATNYNSRNVAKSAPFMEKSESGKAASDMKELDQDKLDAMGKKM